MQLYFLKYEFYVMPRNTIRSLSADRSRRRSLVAPVVVIQCVQRCSAPPENAFMYLCRSGIYLVKPVRIVLNKDCRRPLG